MYRSWQGICLSVVIAFCSGCYTWITVLDLFYWSFWNFADVFIMVWGCACGLDIIVGLFFITFCRTCFSMGDLGVQVSVHLFVRSVCPSVCPSIRQHLPCVSCERNSSYSFYAPPPESGGVLCYTLRNFECPSVRPSVRASVRPSVSAHHHSCIGNSSYSFRPTGLQIRCVSAYFTLI